MAFEELRKCSEKGEINYPYGTREIISVIKHLHRFPSDSISVALSNVLSFDTTDQISKKYIEKAFKKVGIDLDLKSILDLNDRLIVNDIYGNNNNNQKNKLKSEIGKIIENNRKLGEMKHGKIDPQNNPHSGGNTWAGGSLLLLFIIYYLLFIIIYNFK